LIRWTLPQIRFKIARSSHSIVVDGGHNIVATMIYGVRRIPIDVALKGAKVVQEAAYPVEDAERGLTWNKNRSMILSVKIASWIKLSKIKLENTSKSIV